MTLQVNGISHDMTSVLDELRDIGAKPEKTSPARWISLLRGKPTNLPGYDRPLMIIKPRPVIRSDVWKLRVAGMINRCRWIYCKTSKLHIKY